jgi:hypothetical protein
MGHSPCRTSAAGRAIRRLNWPLTAWHRKRRWPSRVCCEGRERVVAGVCVDRPEAPPPLRASPNGTNLLRESGRLRTYALRWVKQRHTWSASRRRRGCAVSLQPVEFSGQTRLASARRNRRHRRVPPPPPVPCWSRFFSLARGVLLAQRRDRQAARNVTAGPR